MEKLSLKTKLSFGLGAFGKDLVYAIVSTFLMIYLTDTRMVAPAFVGTLFLVARIWDAVNDPFMGIVVDNTRSKWGKFRPWLMFGTVLNAAVLVLLYFNNNLTGNSYKVYIAIFYILWGMTYTVMDIPYWSMVPALTSDAKEREQISAIPRLFASFAWLIVGTFGLRIVSGLGNGDDQQGFFLFALIIAIVFVLSILLTVINVKEHVATKNTEKTTVKKMIQVLTKNDQVLVMLGIALFFNIAYQLSNSFALYYFKYVTGNQALYATYAAVAGFTQMGALALFPKISEIVGRKKVYFIACLSPIVGFGMLLGAGYVMPLSIVGVGLCSAIINIGIGFMLVLITVMLADVVDYGEAKLHSRNESIIFSMQTFVVKFAGAFSGFLSGIGLTIIGYVPEVQQTAKTIAGIRIIMIALPALLFVLCLIVYQKSYKLTGNFLEDIKEELPKSA